VDEGNLRIAMNRKSLIAILLIFSSFGCTREQYTFVPKGPAIETRIAANEGKSVIQMRWSEEWLRWAKENDVVLEGYRIGGRNCQSGNNRFQTEAVGPLVVNVTSGAMLIKSETAAYTCKSDSKYGGLYLRLYAVYRGKFLDPDEWQKPAVVVLTPDIR
jgi:hypothetical protein